MSASRVHAAEKRAAPGNPAPWTCLIYHDVTPGSPGVTGGKDYFSVSSATFRRQLEVIEELGYRGCSIASAIGRPDGAVAISFDDGDLGQATRAFPALAARNMTATFFVTTAWMDRPGYASWNQLREMQAAGMSIQSHTHTHPFLSELDRERLQLELRRSREILDERLGQTTTMIAYPGGDAPAPRLRHLLAEEGYRIVATSRWGRNSPRITEEQRFIRRCTVRGSLDEAGFAAIVSGDTLLSFRRQARERVLAFLRSSLGPSRYARWRRRFLNTVGQAS